jgi:hypothetical protein
MMMMLAAGVEYSAKIAMRTLRARRDATGLLPDIDQTRCIFLIRPAMHILRSHAFFPHGVVIDITMNNEW